ncbi:hypothetical protein GS506_07785 [Rhodococcus hoagii]|nr:hypothetical protein [Prescottella equi]
MGQVDHRPRDARGRARYRMLDTVRGYGRERLDETATDVNLRLRFRDWYTRMALDAEADWISPRSSTGASDFTGSCRTCGRHSTSRSPRTTEAHCPSRPPFTRSGSRAACSPRAGAGSNAHSTKLIGNQPPSKPNRSSRPPSWPPSRVISRSPLPEPRTRSRWSRRRRTHRARAYVAMAAGITAFCSGDLEQARVRLRFAADTPGVDAYPQLQLEALSLLGWAHVGDHTSQALTFQGRALAIAQGHGEYIHRGYSLWPTESTPGARAIASTQPSFSKRDCA